jgi:fucose 4-O-acetylase-like acetyltransferase
MLTAVFLPISANSRKFSERKAVCESVVNWFADCFFVSSDSVAVLVFSGSMTVKFHNFIPQNRTSRNSYGKEELANG